jgi:hypothetical protein
MSSAAFAIVVVVGLWALLRSESGRGLVLCIVGAVCILAAPVPWSFLGFVLLAAGIPAAVAGDR